MKLIKTMASTRRNGFHQKESTPLPVGLFVITFDWVIQFCWNFLTFPKIYMEWIFRKKFFGIARIFGPGTNLSTCGRIKILPNFKFSQIYMYYILLKSHWAWCFSVKSFFLCIQHAKSSIKTILSKILEQTRPIFHI